MPEPLWHTRGLPLAPVLFAVTIAASQYTIAFDVAPATAQSSIGIYSDVSGSNCTLAVPSSGLIEAYVVVRPGPRGATAVEFSAPKPACFNATWVEDIEAPGTLLLGDSQTGAAVSLLGCHQEPMHVLTIRYAATGATATCCAYPVLPDPTSGATTVVDCAYLLESSTGVVSNLNPDASCVCTGNSAPEPPQNPVPQDGGLSISVFQKLAWTALDYDDNVAEYDLFFGADPAPPLVATGLPTATYDPGQLAEFTQYWWKVIVRDARGIEVPGEVWTFTTRAVNSPPAPPGGPLPANGAANQRIDVALEWRTTDIDGDTLRFDVYFGSTPDPVLALEHTVQWSYSPGPLAFATKYYWRVVVFDGAGHAVEGPLWSFTTRPANYPPEPPYAPYPADRSTGRPLTQTLGWKASDPDADPLVFDVYFGTSTPPPLVATAVTATAYAVPSLEYMTTYYWRVVARDPSQAERSSATWSFTTRPENFPPAAPSSPSPANNATGRPLSQSLGWQCSDLDGHALVYDIYFGTVTPPPLVKTAHGSRTYSHGTLAPTTRYYWRIVARDVLGAETAGGTWSFTTRANSAPNAPSSPSPGNNSTGRPIVTTLAWSCSDPDGHALTYDVYFGTTTEPEIVATDDAAKAYAPDTLAFGTKYYWRVVARDALGAEKAGSLWNFTTRLENLPPTVPSAPSPPNEAINRSVTTALLWFCAEPEGEALTYDLYFGPESSPPLHASGLTSRIHEPGLLEVSSRYYWKVVARDARGAESVGPVWSFYTSANHAPEVPAEPSPADDGVSSLTPVLAWTSSDPDGQVLFHEVYFGTASPPPLAEWGLYPSSYTPGALQSGTRYYWRVVASDGQASRSGPVWSFVATVPGDVDHDASVTLADAASALELYLHTAGSAAASAIASGDVDCSGAVTPRDARCIHRHVTDGSCAFCDPGASLAAAPSGSPALSVASLAADDDSLVVRLGVSGVPSLASFGFDVTCGEGVAFVRAARVGALSFAAISGSGAPGASRVGGYALEGVPAETATEFLEVRFLVPDGAQMLQLDGYVDDLAGAAPLAIAWNGTPNPVLFAGFEARAKGDGVELRWELSGDETARRFRLLRREEASESARVVLEGGVVGTTGSYLDASVEPATTYYYELVVRTTEGREFRSPVATVTTTGYALSLDQNHPNPFNPTTVIPYTLPGGVPPRVRLMILDVSGRVVRTLVDEPRSAGRHEAVWDGRDDRGGPVSSGVYFYVLDAGGERRTRKLVLLK